MLIGSGYVAAAPPPLWGKLAPGPHAVGFRSVWQLDYSRKYNTVAREQWTNSTPAGKRQARPHQHLVSRGAADDLKVRMLHRDYLAIQTEDPRLARFASKLASTSEHKTRRMQGDDR